MAATRPTAGRAPLPTAPLPTALAALVVATVLTAVVESLLGAQLYADHAVVVGAFPVLGLAFVAVGAVAWNRRPDNRTGLLLCVAGAWILAAALGNVDEPRLLAFGLLVGQFPIAATLHLVLAFPSGRVGNGLDRSLILVGYVSVAVVQVPVAFPSVTLPAALLDPLGWAAIGVVVVAAGRVALRVRAAGRGTSERHVLLAVYAFGIGLLLFFPFSAQVLAPQLGLDEFERFALQIAVFALAPFIFAVGLARGGFARTGEVAEFVAWLASPDPGRTSLRDALARVLGDPSLEVVYPRPRTGHLVDAEGRPVARDTDRSRGTVDVPGADGTAATLVYDRVLIADPATVERAGRLASLALEHERLVADLLAEREALRRSRQRVVEIGDLERRRLAQDLHDIVASRLSLAAFHAGRLAGRAPDPEVRAEAASVRDELTDLSDEFRRVVHGVMPALLVERGLGAAVEDLLDRFPLPVDATVEVGDEVPDAVASTAYFVLAETLANVVRHAAARTVTVTVHRPDGALRLVVTDDGVGGARIGGGAGLAGVTDRADALGGHVTLASPPGGGTRLEVVLPCGS